MNNFDKYVKSKVKENPIEIPDSVKDHIEKTLAELPEKDGGMHHRVRRLPRVAAAAAAIILITLFVLPNISVAYAQTLKQIPIIGDVVRVITIRNYFYSDDRHEMDIDIPQVEGDNREAVDYINKDVSELTEILVRQFYKELETSGNSGYGSIHVDYETVTDTGSWFTLKLSVLEISASSNNYFRFYHIDKLNGKIVELSDLFINDKYSEILTAEIKKQMKEEMEADENVVYWINDSEIGQDFADVTKDQNFYWNENGELVIAFDKYEVAPGYMGTPEFVIGNDVIKDILKDTYKSR